MLTVDKDNVRISEFITSQRRSFKTKEVFYEFDQDEDLLYCKEIVVMKRKWIREGLKLVNKVSNSSVFMHCIEIHTSFLFANI